MTGPCPSCGEPTVAGASYCEACGAELATPAACVGCGAGPEELQDGYCLQCGHKQPAARDHVEAVSGRVAGTSDRGRRHHHNEDAMAFADDGRHLVMVVCDGVSTTDNADQASQAAADAALATLLDELSRDADPADAMLGAATAAQHAVLRVPDDAAARASPSCTLVAAVVGPGEAGATEVTVGWLGDSRAYWLGTEPVQLTRDHSLAAELVAAGEVSEDEARGDPRASSITRWIGADAADPRPQVETFRFDDQARVLVCSDGLWNYAPGVEELLARPELDRPTRLDQTAGLVDFANEAGGHDNITAVIGSLAFEADAAAGSNTPRPT